MSLSSFSKDASPAIDDGQTQCNGAAIEGPGFRIDIAAIDLAAGLVGMPKERARKIAEICARDWATNGEKPRSPMAVVKRAMQSEINQAQVQDVRLEAAKASGLKSKASRATPWAKAKR